MPGRALLLIAALLFIVQPAQAETVELRRWMEYLESLIPTEPAKFSPGLPADVAKATKGVEQWAVVAVYNNDNAAGLLAGLRELLEAKARCDRLLDRAFEQRTQFVKPSGDAAQRDAIRSYLHSTAKLIDLSGRLRYLLSDGLNDGVAELTSPAQRDQLLDLLIAQRSSIGANATAGALLEPMPRGAGGAAAESAMLKLLRLLGSSGQSSLLPRLVQFLDRPDITPALRIAAIEAIEQIGVPQNPRQGSPEDTPTPAVTAWQIHERLVRIDAAQLTPALAARRSELLASLDSRARHGLAADRYRMEGYEVQPGDWLLMRNPSPFNLFTDLSPGLFTHVGIVTTETASDGVKRMVLIDLQEKIHRIAATNVELFVQRSLHYVFLRHPDPHVAAQMSEAARSIIGNESEFDLNFRTSRVLVLAHQPLAGKKISTYCAGLLLLSALQTDVPREEFFPIVEVAAPGKTVENLATLGMSVGKDFISPTGALFSPKMVLVGRREPMYDPSREIEEAVFDYFADRLVDKKLNPAVDLFDSLRMKVAAASSQNPSLARAMAAAAGVAEDTDLVAAARGAAVVDTLDEVAFGASAEYVKAREALRSPPTAVARNPRRASGNTSPNTLYQQRHADLYRQFQSDQLAPRDLRIALVREYTLRGKREIDRRFFGSSP